MRCYPRPKLMRFASPCLAVLAFASITTAPMRGVAQDDASPEPDAKGDAEESAIIASEPFTPDRDALAHNAALLDELLTRSTEQTIREQKFAAAAGLTGGAILLGLSGWRLIEDPPTNQYTRGLGVMFMTLGMADITTGVFAITRIPHEKRRLDRWERARRDGITAMELAHFEGELQSARDTRQGERLLVRWNGLTHAIGGIVVMALTPIPDSMSGSDRVSGYIIGGVFTFTGMAAFGLSFRKTPSEKAWDDYTAQRARMPGHELSWSLAPAVSRRSFGLSLQGVF